MEKTRVKKGEKYYIVNTTNGSIEVDYLREWGQSDDDAFFASGNYFHTKEEAEAMARKIRAVLNGAEVIEMPSEEECETFAVELARENAFVSETFSTGADWRMSSRMTIDWLKFKIVK